ncbi:hypothetical protein [Qipengyuania flava]|uniref:hypothetical protein n=1 Tax=Qipengyuania flava TaxID=192812 RepID=UPI00273E3330|nr:hypothetical protein [Qipengyuania flava]
MTREELGTYFVKRHEKVIKKFAGAARFSIQDCKDLDSLVRQKQPDKFEPLSDQSLIFLQAKLDSYASLYETQQKFQATDPEFDVRTSASRIFVANSLRTSSSDLLDQLDKKVEDASLSDIGHLGSPVNLLIYDSKSWDQLISSLEYLIVRCDSLIRYERTNKPATTKKSENDQLLIARLALLYAHVWGKGKITVSVNFNGGGPSVRFMQEAASRICGRPWSADKIMNLYRLSGKRPFDGDDKMRARDYAQL